MFEQEPNKNIQDHTRWAKAAVRDLCKDRTFYISCSNTTADLLFFNEPASIAVDNFRNYIVHSDDPILLMNLIRFDKWISECIGSLPRKAKVDGRMRGTEIPILCKNYQRILQFSIVAVSAVLSKESIAVVRNLHGRRSTSSGTRKLASTSTVTLWWSFWATQSKYA